MSDEETVAVPKKATEAMTKAGAEFAMQADLSSDYPWPVYISDLWAVMVANAPAPKSDAPVCVEVASLIWEERAGGCLVSETPFGTDYFVSRYGSWWLVDVHQGEAGTLEAAQAACQADFTRRILELVNARSVESVKAERDQELMATAKAEFEKAQSKRNRACGASLTKAVDRTKHTFEWLRSLTEGEG